MTISIYVRRLRSSLVLFAIMALLTGVGSLAACNTTEGVGKDIKAAGNGIENAAEKAK